jgi:hypothetical protein
LPAATILLSVNIAVYNERLAIILGFITLIFTLALFFSCRIFVGFIKILGVKNHSGNLIFGFFHKYHSIYWWGLLLALSLHTLVALMHIRFNDPADPDAYLHPYIFLAGIVALILTLVIYTSCRSFSGLLNLITGKNPLSGKVYTELYRFHSLYWIVLLATVVIHFTLGYLHTGIWVY